MPSTAWVQAVEGELGPMVSRRGLPMRRRISIDQVRVGMKIVRMDRSWLRTPFLSHSMVIKEEREIQQLRSAGIRQVEIDDSTAGETSIIEDADPPLATAQTQGDSGDQEAAEQSCTIPFEEELPLARRTYQDAKRILGQAMHDVRKGKDIRADEIARVVRDLTDSILRNRDALISLTRLKSFDEYTFFHSVNTAILALGLGSRRGLEWEVLSHLGCGTLLHDIGKMKIPLEILNKPARLEADEFEIMKQHALHGVDILHSTTGFPETVVRPALEHHERVNGTGYPFQRTRDDLSQFGLIASVVDIYDAVTSDRVYHRADTPHRALQLLFGLGRQGHLDPQVVEQFIQCVGVYPVGSCVALESGEIGIVRQPQACSPLSPILLLVRDAHQHAGHTTQDSRPLATGRPTPNDRSRHRPSQIAHRYQRLLGRRGSMTVRSPTAAAYSAGAAPATKAMQPWRL